MKELNVDLNMSIINKWREIFGQVSYQSQYELFLKSKIGITKNKKVSYPLTLKMLGPERYVKTVIPMIADNDAEIALLKSNKRWENIRKKFQIGHKDNSFSWRGWPFHIVSEATVKQQVCNIYGVSHCIISDTSVTVFLYKETYQSPLKRLYAKQDIMSFLSRWPQFYRYKLHIFSTNPDMTSTEGYLDFIARIEREIVAAKPESIVYLKPGKELYWEHETGMITDKRK